MEMKKNRVNKQTIAISATFTAEPVAESLALWMQELAIPAAIEFAPYNQVFQQLLDPLSLLSKNEHGINVILVSFEDWQKFEAEVEIGSAFSSSTYDRLEHNFQDFLLALKSATERSTTPCLVCLCPSSPTVLAESECAELFKRMEERVMSALSSSSSIYLITPSDVSFAYPVEAYYDPHRDKLGHIPYTPLFFSALGTILARKIYALSNTPHKVIVLDCDQTLWRGICGEDGVLGIEIDPPRKFLQEFMVAHYRAGMLLCLCSKNNEEDVVEVFERRPEMPLKREHIVSWRINWQLKSQNIRALATELNLGLDSFIFIDDNPVECADMQANCPEVLTLQLPEDLETIPRFLNHIWAFDHVRVTEEDRQRTSFYKVNLERESVRSQSLTLSDFIESLNMEIQISTLEPQHFARAAQLTQRTNQLNFTTVRRSEAEMEQIYQGTKAECLVVEVKDRFGSYGLAGVIILDIEPDAIKVDTFLLSCRVLGRGVEHFMLARLGEIAQARGLIYVDVLYRRTLKNQLSLKFLQSVGDPFQQSMGDDCRFKFPAEFAAGLTYKPSAELPVQEDKLAVERKVADSEGKNLDEKVRRKSDRLSKIAAELYSAEQVLKRIEQQEQQQRQLEQPLVAPRTEIEIVLIALWKQVLRVEAVGIRDSFFELGGTSVLAVQMFAQIEKTTGKKLPIATLFQAPTVEQLADVLRSKEGSAPWSSLVPIQPTGSKPPLFCIHEVHGDILFYRDLSSHLGSDQPCYGLQAQGMDGQQQPYTRIEAIAAHHIREICTLQPRGPYFLLGFCLGGVLAFEMAQQLHAQGQEVAFLALINSHAAGHLKRLPFPKRAIRHLNNFSRHGTSYIFAEWRIIGIKNRLQAEFRKTLSKFHLIPNASSSSNVSSEMSSEVTDRLSVTQANLEALNNYKPHLYPGRITFFQPVDRATWGGWELDPQSAWGVLAGEGLYLYEVPGEHNSMLTEPYVQTLAKKMKASLERVQES